MAKQLGNVTKQVVARAISISRANAVAAAQPSEIDKEKAPRAMKPEASVTGQRQTTTKVVDYANAGEGSRAMPTVGMCGRMEAGPPQLGGEAATPSMRRHMFTVVEGGGRQDEGVRPVGRTRAGGTSQRVFLKLVHAADLSKTGVSMRSRNS
jgi:hypothetical protein